MAHYRIVHRPGGVIHSLVYHIRFVSVRREGPCNFQSENIPSNVLATVRSWIRGFSGSHLFSSLFIRASVSKQFRLWFPLNNLSSLRPRARCFYRLVVSPCPLWCSAPQFLLPLIGSLRACPWPQDNLPSRPQIPSRFSLCSSDIRFLRGILPAVRKPLQSEWRGRSRCSVENHYLHIEYKKTLNCLYKCINDCLIHTNAVQECYWIANSVIKMLMNGLCTILFACCLYWISRWCKWLEC